jgi:hypothetical protein
MAELKAARPEDLPKATHEGKSVILGIEVRTYRLDDGRAVIHADDFHKILEAMGLDGLTVNPFERGPQETAE